MFFVIIELLVVLTLFISKYAHSGPFVKTDKIRVGILGGLPYTMGDFSNYYNGAYYFSFGSRIPLAIYKDIVRLRVEVQNFKWNHRFNNESLLSSFGGALGLELGIEPYRFFRPYFSAGYTGHYFSTMSYQALNKQKSFKSGLYLSLGNSLYMGNGLSMKVDTGYNYFRLSDTAFQNIFISLGVFYSYNDYKKEELVHSREEAQKGKLRNFEKIFKMAEGLLKEGKLVESEKVFLEARLYKIEISKVDQKLTHIKNLKIFEEGHSLYKGGQPYKAIKVLDHTNFPRSLHLLNKIREGLSAEIPGLIKKGILAYKKNNFNGCIRAMEKILTINPNQKEARIYLARAQKKKAAYLRLR